MPEFADLSAVLGADEYVEAAAAMEKRTQHDIKNDGVKVWAREPKNHFRADWRVTNRNGHKDVEINFFRLDTVDPLGEFLGERETGDGECRALPMSFGSYLRQVIEAFPGLGPGFPATIVFVDDILGWNCILPGKGLWDVHQFVLHLLETVDVNIPEHLPELFT